MGLAKKKVILKALLPDVSYLAFAVVGRGYRMTAVGYSAAAVDVLVLKNRWFLASCPMRII